MSNVGGCHQLRNVQKIIYGILVCLAGCDARREEESKASYGDDEQRSSAPVGRAKNRKLSFERSLDQSGDVDECVSRYSHFINHLQHSCPFYAKFRLGLAQK